ncbi:Glycosyl hydrolase, all-beta [Sesbania bispinosa]|nr:Glycosyl hydrolase, all-beta [Sesbania bispinosa]
MLRYFLNDSWIMDIRNLKGNSNSLGFDTIDKWGRMLPDPERWPSSSEGRGLTEVADKVHKMGLKFGIHLMAGISTQAFNNNTPIRDTTTGKAYMEYGREWYAKDIGIPTRACKWMTNGFMAINATTGAGKAFLRSIYELYASWGVDFVKLDCVFGDDLDLDEITSVSQILKDLNHSIVLSLSPGVKATPEMAKAVSGLVNTYRVTGDDWDEWPAIIAHFNVSRDFAAAKLIGGKGLKGNSWPDLDMLPFGWLTEPGVNQGPNRFSKLSHEEQRTQFPYIKRLNDVKTEEVTYVTFFNLNDENTTISTNIADLAIVHGGRKLTSCKGMEMWSGRTIKTYEMLSAEVVGHGCTLFVLNCS